MEILIVQGHRIAAIKKGVVLHNSEFRWVGDSAAYSEFRECIGAKFDQNTLFEGMRAVCLDERFGTVGGPIVVAQSDANKALYSLFMNLVSPHLIFKPIKTGQQSTLELQKQEVSDSPL